MSTGGLHLVPQHRKQFKLRHVGDAMAGSLGGDYLVKGLIEPATLNVIYGEPGCGKSFLALHVAYAVSLGRKVFGRRVKAAPVLYATLEGERGFHRRVAAAVDRWGASPAFHYIAERIDLFGGIGDVEALVDAILGVGAQIVAIDTLARAMGGGSENEFADMGQLIAAFDFLRGETGCAVLVIHHTGKDGGKGPRGHSSLVAAYDTGLEIKREEAAHFVRVAKSKDGVDGDTVSFDLDVVVLGKDADGESVTSCIVHEGHDRDAPAKVPAIPALALRELRRLLCDEGVSPPPSDRFPRGVMSVTLERWKEHLCHIGVLNPEGNPREQFRRINVTLQNARLIGAYDGWVWPVT